MQSPKNNLNKDDINKWLANIVIFSSPAFIAAFLAFLISLSGDKQITKSAIIVAVGMGIHAGVSALIDLLQKYKSGS